STLSAMLGIQPYKTIILTDYARLNPRNDPQLTEQITTLKTKLATFAARPEISGVVVDVGQDAAVRFAQQQADANFECIFAKNLAAGAIKSIVSKFRDRNPIQYVLIVGNDYVIPFFRHPDEAL